MPVTAESFLWEATGHHPSGTSCVVTHPDAGGTTAGTTVVVFIYHGALATVTLPAGFMATGSGIYCAAAWKSNVGAGETSWTFTVPSGSAAWYMAEVDNLNLDDPLDVATSTASPTSTVNGGTRSSQASQVNSSSSTVGLGFWGATKAGSGDVQSWSAYTNGYAEVVDYSPAGVAGKQLAVARKFPAENTFATHESTATFATSAASANTFAAVVLLRSADASINAPLSGFTGFELGTHAGWANLPPNNPLSAFSSAFGTWGTAYSVVTRAGSYKLKIVSTGTAVAVPVGAAAVSMMVCGVEVDVESATGQAEIFRVVCSGTNLVGKYDVATSQVGLCWDGGTVQWQTGTTPLNTPAWVDFRLRGDAAVHHADWSISTGTGDGSQTSPADLTGQAVASSMELWLGANAASQTVTAYYDNPVTSVHFVAYPLGAHTVRLLVPETTGATVSGTATNFSRFTANGTLAAVSVDTVGALLDEVPPTVSASSDGVVQTAVAASDYVNLPMTTYTLASDEIIAGVRALASLWGGTGSGTGTLGFRGHDGTAETTFVAAGTSFDPDSLTTASATYPRWYMAMWPGGVNGAWTQARLDAAALRLGFSTDATPDMGASAMYLEVATRPTPVYRQITTGEADEFTVDLRVDPYNSASVSYLVESTHATLGATFYYSISGTPQTPVVVAPSSTEEVVVNAASFGEISDVSLEPDPLP